eukprot:evm.model.NODE_29734_length_17783_cov_16.476580.4
MVAGFDLIAVGVVFMEICKEWSRTLAPGPKESVVMSVTNAQEGWARAESVSAVGLDMAVR